MRGAVQQRAAVDHAEPARALGGERQRKPAAGERERDAAHVLRRADLQHRPHQAQLVDLEAAAEQCQRLEPEVEPVDPQRALGRRPGLDRVVRASVSVGRGSSSRSIRPWIATVCPVSASACSVSSAR